MSKKVAMRSDIPQLSIVFYAAGQFPVTVELQHDWEQNGEYSVFCKDISTGRSAAAAIEFAFNALADEVLDMVRRKDSLANGETKNAPL